MALQNAMFRPPKDKEEILDEISKLTFKQRLQYAADIGRKCENANDLIKALRENPKPEAIVAEMDDDLVKILAPQERNVAKYYHQHQIALTAAVSSKNNLDLLREEVKSQSKFFKKYAIRHYIKQQPDDDEIVSMVKSVAPSVQKRLIHVLIKEKRVKALDVLCEELRKIAGIDCIIDFMHGCSSEKLRECLAFQNIFKHTSLRWDKIYRFHQKMIMEMMDNQLDTAAKTWGKYNAIFTIWTKRDRKSKYQKNRLNAWEQMLQTGTYQSGALWDLALKYPHCVIDPCLTYKENKEFEKEIAANDHIIKNFEDIRIKKILPDFIRDKFNYFARRNPDKFLKFVEETTKINMRGVIRHSVPGKLWMCKDFSVENVFKIMEICKAKSSRKRLFPYTDYIQNRDGKSWSLNIYKNDEKTICGMQYGAKLKEKVGFDHQLICQISRAKSKKTVFYSFSPRQMEKLINFVYDWMEEMEPKGDEINLYDNMAWIELLSQWTQNWLNKLYTKRNKKENVNRYQPQIELLTMRYMKLFDKLTNNEWRSSFKERMSRLEQLAIAIWDAKYFWDNKCEHETSKEATKTEISFANQLTCLLTFVNDKDLCKKGKTAQLNVFEDGMNKFLLQFNVHRKNMHVNEGKNLHSYYNRHWPLKSQLDLTWRKVLQLMKEEANAQFNYDYFVSFHMMRNVRKIRSKQKYEILDNLLKILYERRPMLYKIKWRNLSKMGCGSTFYSSMQRWMSLNETIICEIWDEAMNKKQVLTEYGWNLARDSLKKYLNCYQYVLSYDDSRAAGMVSISYWYSSRKTMKKYGDFRAGGSNADLVKKPFKSPSLVLKMMEFIKNPRINQVDSTQLIPLKLVREIYDVYILMLEQTKPMSVRHCQYNDWVDDVESCQREFIQLLQKYLNEKIPQIEAYKKEHPNEEEEEYEDEDVVMENDEKEQSDDDDKPMTVEAMIMQNLRGGRGRGRGRGRMRGRVRGRGRGLRGRGRGRGMRGRRGPPPIPMPTKSLKELKKAAKRKEKALREIRLSERQRHKINVNGVEFVKSIYPKLMNKLLDFYAKPARAKWVEDRESLQRVYNVLHEWESKQPEITRNASRVFNKNDTIKHDLLGEVQKKLNESDHKHEAFVHEYGEKLAGSKCKTYEQAMNLQLPTLHADNQKRLTRLAKKAYDGLWNHIRGCSDNDRRWMQKMAAFCGLCCTDADALNYDCIYQIFKEFVPVFETSQFWPLKNKIPQLMTSYRLAHLNAMLDILESLTTCVERLEIRRSKKIDLLKQSQHEKTVNEEKKEGDDKHTLDGQMMDVDNASSSDGMKDGTFETMEITKINGWISEVIMKTFNMEMQNTLKEVLNSLKIEFEEKYWWKPNLLDLFERVMPFAPNDDFAKLFGALKKEIIAEMKGGNKSLLNLLKRRLRSKIRCESESNWFELWQTFLVMRSQLENGFDDVCADFMINEYTTAKQRQIIFDAVATEDHLKLLCNQRPAVFVKLFGALCDFPNRTNDESRSKCNDFLNYFLAEDEHNASPDTKDQLLRYLDVRDHKIRKRLAKLTDSNSVDEREAGYRTLITATLLVNNAERDVHIKRTVKFFMTKLKNEAIDRREMGLEILFGELKNQNELILESDDCLKFLSEMLQDCLEVQDLDKDEDNKEWENITEHKILRHFMQLSVDAIEMGVKDLDGPLLDFGVDLQWRMCVFRKGNTDAAEQFRINFGSKLIKRHVVLKGYLEHMEKYGTEEGENFDGIFFYEDEEEDFVKKYMKLYEDRTKEYFADYLESSVSAMSFMEPLFLILGSNWHKSETLLNLLEKLIADFEDLDFAMDDDDDMNVMDIGGEIEEATAKVVTYIVKFNGDKWIDIKVIRRFISALFAAFEKLHKMGYDDILLATQNTLVYMLDSVLYSITKSKQTRKGYKDDICTHEIFKLLLDCCMNMLSVKYVKKQNGRFWRMQWELHKIFRGHMSDCDDEIDTILHIDNVNDLPSFKWTLFRRYWDVCVEGLKYAMDESESYYLNKGKNDTMDVEEEKAEMEIAKELPKYKERVITLFKSDEEKEIWRYELAIWCVDMACSWIFGGEWLEIALSPVSLLVTNNVDWRGFMLIPTETVFAMKNKPLLRFRWSECNVITQIFEQILRSLTVITDIDADNLRIFEAEHPAVMIMEKLIEKFHTNRSRNIRMKKKFHKFWFEIDLVDRYMATMMKSRQIKLVLWRWWHYKSNNKIVKKNGRKTVILFKKSVKKRTAAVNELLSITKSAIYLRLVWRHLLQYDQQKLTKYLESNSCFRGVFYLEPDDRKYTRKQQKDRELRKEQELARYDQPKATTSRMLGVSGALKKVEINKRSARRGGGKEATRRVLGVQADARKKGPKVKKKLTAKEQVDKENEAQKKFEVAYNEWKEVNDAAADDKKRPFDHRDLWIFEGCYQLNRLLPDQLDEIGKKHLAAASNKNRGMPERVKSIIRWTLLPTTTYNDIVDYFNSVKKMPINLIEALLKGVMENDEVLAPMHYLLDPKFLSSQQARIAAFAITKCVPHIARRRYTDLLRAVLSGKRRTVLKVTAYKQIIRMLIAKPSRMHIQMVVHEWDRNQLHRDVRIVILQAAFAFIRRSKPISFGSDASWHIFESAVSSPAIRSNVEIMTALMGCKIDGQAAFEASEYYKGLVLKPRLLDHLDTFKECPIPKKHAAKWAKLVIIVLCDRVYTMVPVKEEDNDTASEKKEGDNDTDTKMVAKVNEDTTKEKEKDNDEDTEMKGAEDGTEEEEEEDDGKGPYLMNEGKPRCLDDIAFLAMRSLEMWVKYNDAITRDALRIVGETICDFSIDFIANENEDIHKINWNRFEMAVGILRKTLKIDKAKAIRSKFLPVITDIVGRFNAVINGNMDNYVDVYKFGADSSTTISDKYGQCRDYISRVTKRLTKFFALLGSFKHVPIEYYKSIIAPLDSGNARGMYIQIVMKKRKEMMENYKALDGYFDLCIDFIADLLYFGCLDPVNFANNEVFSGCVNIWKTLTSNQKAQILTILMLDNFEKRDQSLYLDEILQSDAYKHLRECLILNLIKARHVNGEVIVLMSDVFIKYFVQRIKVLADSINGPLQSSKWRQNSLTFDEVDSELNVLLSFAISIFSVHRQHKMSATLYYYKTAKSFFDLLFSRANKLSLDSNSQKICSIEDWLYCKMFSVLCRKHMNILMILYGNDLISLIKIPILLKNVSFVTNKANPFKSFLTITQIFESIWSHCIETYFYRDWDQKRQLLISTVFKWFLQKDQNENNSDDDKFNVDVLDLAVKCLTSSTYQKKAWLLLKDRLVEVFDAISSAKLRNVLDPVIRGNKAIEMYDLVQNLVQFVNSERRRLTLRNYDYSNYALSLFMPLYAAILNRSTDHSQNKSDWFHQRIFLRLIRSSQTIFILDNKLQKIFDFAIDSTTNYPKDGKNGLDWTQICDLIQIICNELSPYWSSKSLLNQKAIQLIKGLFSSFTSAPLSKQSDLAQKELVHRNICIHLLSQRSSLCTVALESDLLKVLTYFIDLHSAHNKEVRTNPRNRYFDAFGSFEALLRAQINNLNPQWYRTQFKSVNPISGSLICQIFKDALDSSSANNELCSELLFSFMSKMPSMLTQSIYSPDLVKMISWSIDYSKSIKNIIDFLLESSLYLSPQFGKNRIYENKICAKYWHLLINEYCDFSNIYSPKTKQIGRILQSLIKRTNGICWLTKICGKESLNLVYAISIQYALNSFGLSEAHELILNLVQSMNTESKHKNWKRINIENYSRQQNEKEKNNKKAKRSINEIYENLSDEKTKLMPETLQIIHRIFEKKVVETSLNLSLRENAIWNDFMMDLAIKIMEKYKRNLLKSGYFEVTKSFFVCYFEYVSKIPLRERGYFYRRFVSNYFENTGLDSIDIAVWVEWMLKYRKNLDFASRDVVTRFALALVVKFGHSSCKKARRIEHEMKKEKEKENETMDVDDNNGEDENDNDDGKESVASFESEADDNIIWAPQWIEYLNEFSNDSNAVIRMMTRQIGTVFMDWKEHKEAEKTYIKKIIQFNA